MLDVPAHHASAGPPPATVLGSQEPHMARALKVAITMAAAISITVAVAVTPASATPPNIPSYSTALSRLNALTVAAESHQSTYNRDLFPHWITITGSCNTREQVLKRDGTNVVVNSSCAADLRIVVQPVRRGDLDQRLRRRHRPHGAARRGLELRRLGVDDGAGGRPTPTTSADPSCGRSPTTSTSPRATRTRPTGSRRCPRSGCTYARAWIQVKYYYGLTVDSAEKSALNSMLATC